MFRLLSATRSAARPGFVLNEHRGCGVERGGDDDVGRQPTSDIVVRSGDEQRSSLTPRPSSKRDRESHRGLTIERRGELVGGQYCTRAPTSGDGQRDREPVTLPLGEIGALTQQRPGLGEPGLPQHEECTAEVAPGHVDDSTTTGEAACAGEGDRTAQQPESADDLAENRGLSRAAGAYQQHDATWPKSSDGPPGDGGASRDSEGVVAMTRADAELEAQGPSASRESLAGRTADPEFTHDEAP